MPDESKLERAKREGIDIIKNSKKFIVISEDAEVMECRAFGKKSELLTMLITQGNRMHESVRKEMENNPDLKESDI